MVKLQLWSSVACLPLEDVGQVAGAKMPKDRDGHAQLLPLEML